MFVILRTGKVLEYNDAHYVDAGDGEITLRKDGKTTTFEAIIPLDMIERIESGRPCRVGRVTANPTAGKADY